MTKTNFLTLALSILPAMGWAQESHAPHGVQPLVESPSEKAAKALVETYLNAVKAKNWAGVKKLTHPKSIAAIAERKTRLGKEDHPMAPWYHEKTTAWLKAYRITQVTPSALKTVVVETLEDNFQVQDKAVAENEKGAYLVGQKGGKWYIVDRKRGETFTKPSIKLGYKGWFDDEKEDTATPQ